MNRKLRNRLAEVLLAAIGENPIPLKELLSRLSFPLHPQQVIRVHKKDCKIISVAEELNIFSILDNGKSWDLKLLPELDGETGYLSDRLLNYRRFLSGHKKDRETMDLQWGVGVAAELFNHSLFFECHEFLENYWRQEQGMTKEFLQGFISLATVFYHLELDHFDSALKLLAHARSRLDKFAPAYLGLEIQNLLYEMEIIRQRLPQDTQALKNWQPPRIRLSIRSLSSPQEC